MKALPLENLLQFIWNYKLLKPVELKTVNENVVKIIHPGELNTDSGPDFFNSKIRLGPLTLAGNVEIHVRSGDWIKHGHQNDPSYNNIILHVVYEYDKPVMQNEHYNVEILELKNYIEKDILHKYEHLVSSEKELPCSHQIKKVNSIKLNSWLERMLIERLEIKTQYIKHLFEVSQNDYAQTLYILLSRNLGFKTNSEPFEVLARHLPLSVLLKHKENRFQLEALLYGTGGFLEDVFEDKYLKLLQNEFEFLKHKYLLKPMAKNIWKFLRLRPANFPTVRLWQFAAIIHKSHEIFSNPIRFADVNVLYRAFSIQPNGYWAKHYKLNGSDVKTVPALGKSSCENIINNTIAPFLFFYGKQNAKENHMETALRCFDKIPFEANHKTKLFSDADLEFNTAGQSQALLNLYDNYCKKKLCLKCGIAAGILSGSKEVTMA